MKYLLLLLPLYVNAQCLELGEAFTFTECLEGEEQPYEATCNYGVDWYTSIQFIVPEGSTSTVFMFDDPSLYYSHLSPSSSDLWVLFTVSADCEANDVVYTNSGWCASISAIADPDCCYNDAFVIELSLQPGVYYLHLPMGSILGGSEFAGCYTVSVFSVGLLDLSVPSYWIERKKNLPRFDSAGRKY
jgi:hypothetical protein